MADLNPINSRAPFINQLGGPGTDSCSDIAIDRFDNIFCAGQTNSNLGLGYTNASTGDGFVAKFSREGTLLWIRHVASSNNQQDICQSLGVDDFGNVYCGGSTQGLIGTGQILNKNQQGIITDRSPTATDRDGFVAKINPAGSIVWIKQFGSYGDDQCANVAVSPSGNAYCGGRTNGELGVDALSGTYEYLGATSLNPLVAKIDTYGNILWIRQWGVLSMPSDYTATDYCSGVNIDEDENVYCVGGTQGNIAGTNAGATDIFVWVLDKNGFTTTTLQLGGPGTDDCYDVVVDKDKNIFCAAYIIGNLGEPSGGGSDIGVVKWDKNFNLQWVKQLGMNTIVSGPNSSSEVAQSITLAPNGNIILAGSTASPNFGTVSGSDDAFILSMNANGEVLWGKNFGGSGVDVCVGVAVDTLSNIVCGGYTNSNFASPLQGAQDLFILRVNSLGRL